MDGPFNNLDYSACMHCQFELRELEKVELAKKLNDEEKDNDKISTNLQFGTVDINDINVKLNYQNTSVGSNVNVNMTDQGLDKMECGLNDHQSILLPSSQSQTSESTRLITTNRINTTLNIHNNDKTQQETQPQLPKEKYIIIGLSANSDNVTMEEALNAGMDEFLSKPLSVSTLMTYFQKLSSSRL